MTRQKPIRSILAATDFSPDAMQAVRRAGLLAALLDARLKLLHVMDVSPLAKARALIGGEDLRAAYKRSAARKLEDAIKVLPRGVRAAARSRLVQGSVLDEILDAASGSGLLVLGARGGNPLRDLLLGSTAERLIQKGCGPLLVVKRAPRSEYRRVIVGFDFSADANAALQAALRVAPDARITLVHAYEGELERTLWRGMVSEDQVERIGTEAKRDALMGMDRVAAGLGQVAERVDRIVVRGYPPRVVLDVATRRQADLIAVGKHGRSALEQMLIGSRARHIVADARCDVLVAQPHV